MLLIIFVFIAVVGIPFLKSHEWDFIGALLIFIGAAGFVIFLGCLIHTRFDTATYAEEREALQNTYENARTMNEFERATITKEIASFNRSLAKDKYWNKSIWFDWFINDVVDTVEPIK